MKWYSSLIKTFFCAGCKRTKRIKHLAHQFWFDGFVCQSCIDKEANKK